MKWIFALNEPSERFSEHGRKYEYFAKVAVYSAKKYAPGLRPIMIYNGKENQFTQEIRDLGVQIIFHELSFQAEIENCDSRDDLWRQVAKGAMLRLDIPEVITSDEVVLYTDTDIFFLKDPTSYGLFTNVIAVAPEFDINDFVKVNTGAMLINLGGARHRFKSLIDWTIKNLHLVPDYDQGAIRAFFSGDWDRLDPLMNWKPYWGVNENAIVLHFHGPKPNDFDSLTLQPSAMGGIYDLLYNNDQAAYRYYISKWVAISHEYQLSLFNKN
jgi:lipopolysaccharide biosynthesis glycosyltransferase